MASTKWGTCPFCGTYAKLSREHYWPTWLRRLTQKDAKFTLTRTQGGKTKPWVGTLADLNVRKPCIPCNTGWMNDLQNDAKPIVYPLVRGMPRTLSIEAQRTLAAWATMTAYMYASTSDEHGISHEHFRHLYEHREPDPRTQIRLAAYAGSFSGWFNAEALAFEGPTVPVPPPNGYWISLVIGHLVLQVLGYTGPNGLAFQLRAESRGALFDIQPVSGLRRWPPLWVLDDDGLRSIMALPPATDERTDEQGEVSA